MRRAWVSLLACALALPVAAATPARIDDLAGVYKHRFTNGDIDGRSFESEDILEIVKVAPAAAYVRISLWFFNGHACGISGIAELRGRDLMYSPADRGAGFGGQACTLTVHQDGSRLVLRDDGSCKSYCGVRGSFDGAEFDVRSRRPIRYIARLQSSSQYKAALAERRAGH